MIFALLLLVMPHTSTAPQPVDPAKLFAQSYAASGGAAWISIKEIVETAPVTQMGAGVTITRYIDPRTGYQRVVLHGAAVASSSGIDERGSWREQSGIVESDDGPTTLSDAVDTMYIARNGWWYPASDPATFTDIGPSDEDGRHYEMVEVDPKGGSPLYVYIDSTSHLIRKYMQRGSDGATLTVALDDYRRVNGVLYPFTRTISNGWMASTKTALLGFEAHTQRTTADFSRPPNRAAGSLANGVNTTVPIALSAGDSGQIYVDVTINGRGPVSLFFDSGAQNMLTPFAAKLVGLTSTGTLQVVGMTGNSTASMGTAQTVSIGGATLTDQSFAVLNNAPQQLLATQHDHSTDGFVGYEFLKSFVVSVDYAHKSMTLSDPKSFRYTGSGTAIPFTTDFHTALIRATVDGVPGYFQIDTGNSEALILFSTFPRSPQIGRGVLHGFFGGIGGAPVPQYMASVQSVAVGPYVLKNVPTTLADEFQPVSPQLSSTAVAGNIGAEILSRFTLTFDYARGVVYFEPNASFAQPIRGPRDIGFMFGPGLGGAQVYSVDPKSAAGLAGLRIGDTVASINGTSMATLGAADIERLENTHDTLQIMYKRDGQAFSLTVPVTDFLAPTPSP